MGEESEEEPPPCQNGGIDHGSAARIVYDTAMVRPEASGLVLAACCVELAGESPAAVSADAPRSRPRASGEIPASERGVKCPRVATRLLRRGAKSWAQRFGVNPAAS